jgi:retron-type reverse transcriptase
MHYAQGDPTTGRPGSSLWDHVASFEALHAGYRRARLSKRYQPEVLRFSADLETELITLQNELRWRSYRTSPYRLFLVHDPKRRQIMAPAFRDRVVHHALCAELEPLCERRFIFDSYACRLGKGTHRAMRRLQHFAFAASRRGHRAWALKADVSRYFVSIPHAPLLDRLRRIVTDPDVQWLVQEILASAALSVDPGGGARGLPIGALTSQLFANVYLDRVDHAVKEDWREPWYVRYMDDLVIVSRDRAGLRRRWRALRDLLADIGLELNPKTAVYPVEGGVPFVGYRIWPERTRVLQSTLRGFRRRLRQMAAHVRRGALSWSDVLLSIRSWIAHAQHADSWRVREQILGDLVITASDLRGGQGW